MHLCGAASGSGKCSTKKKEQSVLLTSLCILLADINECSEETHQCTQNCNNTIGSYVCSCNSGFIIDVDGRTCDGEMVDYFIILCCIYKHKIMNVHEIYNTHRYQ